VDKQKDADKAGNPLVMVLPIAAVALCCGGPLLLGLVASAGISGAVMGGLLPLAGLLLAAALAVAGVVWLARMRGGGPDCCAAPPAEPGSRQRSGGLPR
jgi:hypothetical protein